MPTQVTSLEAVFTANTTNFDRGARSVDSTMSGLGTRVSSSMQNIGSSITNVGASLIGLAGPAAAGFGAAVSAAISFESAFAGVVKTVDATDAELAGLQQTIRDMATDVSNPLAGLDNAAITIAEVMELAGQLGVGVADLEQFTQVMGELGMSTNITAQDAAVLVAQFANVTGMSFDNVRNFGSTLVELGNNAATTEQDILNMASRIASAGTLAGMSEPEILAFSTALSSAGISAELGGTNFSRFISDVAMAVATGGDELTLFAQTAGMTADDFATMWGTDATAAITSFVTGLGEMDQATQLTTLTDLGLTGTEVQRVLLSLAGNTDLLTSSLDLASTAWGENSALATEANTRLATTESQMNVVKNQVRDLGIQVGQALIPAFRSILEFISPIITGFTEWAAENPEIVAAVAALTVGVVALGAVLVPAGMALGAIGTIAGVIMSPIGLLIAAVAAFGVAFATNFGGIRDLATQVFDDVVIPAIELFMDVMQGVWPIVEPILGLLWRGFETTFGGVVDLVSAAISAITSIIDAISNAITELDARLEPIRNFAASTNVTSITGESQSLQDIGAQGLVNSIPGVNVLNAISGVFRASGGPVDSGSPYIVGEEGPELFVPEMSGNVISNAQSQDAMGGMHIENLTINADTEAGGRAAARGFRSEMAERMRASG